MARPRPKSRRQYVPQSDALANAAKIAWTLKGQKAGPMPGFIEPCLATLRDKAPGGERWIHEIKYDGYRLQLRKDEGDIRFLTRRGLDWTSRFESLVVAAWHIPVRKLVLDGEVVVQSESGLTDYGALIADLGEGRSDRFIFFAFDILQLEGRSLRACPQIGRKQVLAALLDGQRGPIRFSPHTEGDGEALFEQACALGAEGLVSKRKDAPYRSGRNHNWVKRTCRERDTFILAGVAYKQRNKFDGIYLGRREGKQLLYAGKVENGFDDDDEKKLAAMAERLKSRWPAPGLDDTDLSESGSALEPHRA